MKLYSSLLAICLAACPAACAAVDEPAPDSSIDESLTIAADDNATLVTCKGVAGEKKGDIRVFLRGGGVNKTETHASYNPSRSSLVAIGLSGTYDEGSGKQSISYSQGDQPDLAAATRKEDSLELRFLDKKCAGTCKNTMLLSHGGGEDEETTFIRLKALTLNFKEKSLSIKGESEGLKAHFTEGGQTSFEQTLKPVEFRFKSCAFSEDTLKEAEKSLKR